jgi:hypothetical protein
MGFFTVLLDEEPMPTTIEARKPARKLAKRRIVLPALKPSKAELKRQIATLNAADKRDPSWQEFVFPWPENS